MGTVYAAEHVEIGKDVAIKILHPHYSTEQELVERFRREARAASRIGHPNIIDVMDFGTTEDGCAYFIMEHLDGIDLADVLSHERRLDPNRSCQIADPDLPRAGRRARRRRHPPRSQAREHLPGRARRQGGLRQGARLRHRAQRGPDDAAHQPGHRDGDARVHGARAGGGRRRRSPRRHLFGRRAAVRDGDRAAAAEARRRDRRAAVAAPAAVGGAGSDRRARARAGSGAALPVDGAARIRPGEVAVRADARGRRSARPAPGRGARRIVAARHRRPAQPADAAAGRVAGGRGARTAGRAPASGRPRGIRRGRADPPAPVLGATATTSETTPLPTPQPRHRPIAAAPRGTVPGPGVRAARAVPVPARGLAAAAVAAQR